MSKDIKLSFIIPLFNARSYIVPCIESILSQNIDKEIYEIIVIDDGSNDDGGLIAKSYDQVLYYRQENKGQSASRNKGIELARGEYLCFIDADDLLVAGSLNYCLNVAIENKLDLVTYDIIRCSIDQVKTVVPAISDSVDKIMSGNDYLENYNFNNGPWWYLINKQSLGNQRFVVDRYGEDGMFTTELLMRMKRVVHVNNQCYYYLKRPSSTTTRKNKEHLQKMIEDYLFVYHHIQELINKYGNSLSEKAISRCNERSESYIYFMLVRLLRFPDTSLLKPTIDRLKKEGLYPIRQPYKGILYSITTMVINNYYLLKVANKILALLNK